MIQYLIDDEGRNEDVVVILVDDVYDYVCQSWRLVSYDGEFGWYFSAAMIHS